MKHTRLSALVASACIGALLFAGCGKTETVEAYDNTEEVQAHYAANPEFFKFKTIADLPQNLEWEDGMDLPEIGSPAAVKGGTVRGRLQDFPRTLRIIGPDSNGGFRPYILDDNVMNFARRHPNMTDVRDVGFYYFPGIAEKWAVDRDAKTVYVKINPAARWSDGEAITTEDVAFAFYFYQSEYHRQIWYQDWYAPGVNYASLTIYDDHHFAIELVERRPNMLNLVLELNPIPRHFFIEYGPDYVDRYQWRFVPTSGAYEVREQDIRKGRSIALTRVQDWWAKDMKFWRYRFNYDRIQLDVIRDTPKAFEMFLKGDLDSFGMNLPEYWYEKLPDDHPLVTNGFIHKIKFYNDLPRPTYGLWINRSRGHLANRDVRIGINYATNWDLVCQQYFRGDAIRMNTTADGYGAFTHPELRARPFDVDLALEHFAKAGFTQRGADGILVNERGERLTFEITTGYEVFKDVLTILKQEAQKAGLELRIEVLDGTAGWKKVQEKRHEISFTAFGVSPEMFPRYKETYHSDRAYDKAWTADGEPNPERQVKTQTNNLSIVADRDLDKMIEAYDNSEDVNEMIELAFRIEEFLHDDASFVPGFVIPFYRLAFWRWRKYPADFDVKISQYPGEYYLGWIDEAAREETLRALREGKSFAPVVKVYDQYSTTSTERN